MKRDKDTFNFLAALLILFAIIGAAALQVISPTPTRVKLYTTSQGSEIRSRSGWCPDRCDYHGMMSAEQISRVKARETAEKKP